MIGLGTIINAGAIVLGGLLGLAGGKLIQPRLQKTLMQAMGVCVLFVGLGGALEKMLTLVDGSLKSTGTLMMVISFTLGTVVGEILNLEGRMQRFGSWLKVKTGSTNEQGFVNAFVTASLTVCIGAMAVLGAIQDGISGDYTTLALKGLLDLVIICIMTSIMGKGCIFSAIPVLLLQGSITLLARLIAPVMTNAALDNLALTGSMLIFCVGINLLWENKLRVANMLPTILFAVLYSFLPI